MHPLILNYTDNFERKGSFTLHIIRNAPVCLCLQHKLMFLMLNHQLFLKYVVILKNVCDYMCILILLRM